MKYQPKCETLEARDLRSTIDVGTGFTYTSPDRVPCDSLNSGDIVKIHPKEGLHGVEAYKSFIDDFVSGVTWEGVPDVSGNLPILTNYGAVAEVHSSYFSNQVNDGQAQMIIAPDSTHSTSSVDNVTVQDLVFQGFREAGTNLGESDGIDLYHAHDATLQRLTISNYIDGIFGKSYGSGTATDDVNVQILHNSVTLDGTPNYSKDHDIYMEGEYTKYEYNTIGPNVDTSSGAGIKSRDDQPTIAYNVIYGTLPLNIENPEDGAADLCSDSGYGTSWVYGNQITCLYAQVCWFGYDSNVNYQQKVLNFYDNTVVLQEYRYTDETFSYQGTNNSYVFDNVIAVNDTSNTVDLIDVKYSTDAPDVHFGNNIVPTNTTISGGGATGISWDGASHLNYTGPGFVNLSTGDYRLSSTSPAINAAGGYWTGSTFETLSQAGLTAPASQWDTVNGYTNRTATSDEGAWEYPDTLWSFPPVNLFHDVLSDSDLEALYQLKQLDR